MKGLRKVDPLQINEVFESIQGEGALMGYHTYFIRLQGCQNIFCKFCDTKRSWKVGGKKSVKCHDLVERVGHEIDRTTWICFTGGEPLQQLVPLMWVIDKLHNDDFHKISLETSGVIGYDKKGKVSLPDQKQVIDMLENDVFFSISPKLYSAIGEKFTYDGLKQIIKFWSDIIDLHFRFQFKFVVSCKEDFEILHKLHEEFKFDCNMFMQIDANKMNDKPFIKECFEFSKKHWQFRLVIQQHKVLDIK